MRTSETFHTSSALAALRLINKARQCAKRGDVNGMSEYAEQAYIESACAPTVSVADTRVANVIAAKATHQIRALHLTAHEGQCYAFVRYTRHLDRDMRELVDAMQGERKHGI